MIEAFTYVLVAIVSFYVGYIIAKGIDNNHIQLFQSYHEENHKLRMERDYWQALYENLCSCLTENDVENYKKIVKCKQECQNSIYKPKDKKEVNICDVICKKEL